MWKSLANRVDFLFVPGKHAELNDETRGKICGSMIMTTAAMKFQSTFSILSLQTVRSRRQERLVQNIKQGIVISIMSGKEYFQNKKHVRK